MSKPAKLEIKNLLRYFAITANNGFWKLSEKELEKEEKSKILMMSFASLYHWNEVGNEENKYLAYLAVARALTINNSADLALDYATSAFEFFKDTKQDWIKAFTHAIISNALLLKGDIHKAATHYGMAKDIGDRLEPDDKEIFIATFSLIPKPVV